MSASKKPRRRSTLGTVIQHRNHFSARYWRGGVLQSPGHTFLTFALADQWLAAEQMLIDRDEWTPPAERRAAAQAVAAVNSVTFGEYAERWIANRQVRGRALKSRTAADYRSMLRRTLAPLVAVPIVTIDRAKAAAWYQGLNPEAPVARAHAYSLFRSVMATAVDDGLITTNPVHIRGAGNHTKKTTVELFTAEQIAQLAELMPARHSAAVLIAAWCGLRFGEIAGLRRSDVTMGEAASYIRIERGVVMVDGVQELTTPKSESGTRTVPVPPHIVPALKEHLKQHTQWGKDGLLFPPTTDSTEFITPGQLYGHKPTYGPDGKVRKQGNGFYRARHLLGRDDLSFHKLRHFAATTYAVAGATTHELMSLMGHADPGIAMRYQHAAQSRVVELAERMSALARLTETP